MLLHGDRCGRDDVPEVGARYRLSLVAHARDVACYRVFSHVVCLLDGLAIGDTARQRGDDDGVSTLRL